MTAQSLKSVTVRFCLSGLLLLSLPGYSQDSFEPDNSFDQAAIDSGNRSLHTPEDTDWIGFFLPASQPLRVQFFEGIDQTSGNAGTGMTAEIYRRAPDGRAVFEQTLFAQADDTEWVGFGSYVPPADGFYFVRFRPCTAQDNPACDSAGFPSGGGNYVVEVPMNSNGLSGTGSLAGQMVNSLNGQPVGLAILLTNANVGTFSAPDGNFRLTDNVGQYTAQADARGYRPASVQFTLQEFQTTSCTIELIPADSLFADGFEPFSLPSQSSKLAVNECIPVNQ